MAMQLTNREKLAFKLDHLSETEIEEVAEYVSIMETMRHDQREPNDFDDELVTALSAAYENQRARQVLEWDAVRQRAESRPSNAQAAHR